MLRLMFSLLNPIWLCDYLLFSQNIIFLADRGRAVQHSPDWISVGANKEGKVRQSYIQLTA